MTSPDGSTWTAQTQASGTGSLRFVAWDPVLAKFCYCDSNTTDSTLSTDGITWTRFAANFSGGSLNSLSARNTGGFIGGGHNDRIFSSSTGQASWSGPVTAGGGGFGDTKRVVYSAALGLEIAILSGTSQGVTTSSDNGASWTLGTLATTNPWTGLAAGAALPGSSGTWHTTEATDSFAAIGYPGLPGVSGSLVTTEARDVFAATGFGNLVGRMNIVERSDTFSAFGFQPFTGHMTVTEAPDIFHATGIGRGEDGVWHSTEAPDVFAATGVAPISGTFITTEAPDIFQAFGAGVTRVSRRRPFFIT
jgi:hypothetical protein